MNSSVRPAFFCNPILAIQSNRIHHVVLHFLLKKKVVKSQRLSLYLHVLKQLSLLLISTPLRSRCWVSPQPGEVTSNVDVVKRKHKHKKKTITINNNKQTYIHKCKYVCTYTNYLCIVHILHTYIYILKYIYIYIHTWHRL